MISKKRKIIREKLAEEYSKIITAKRIRRNLRRRKCNYTKAEWAEMRAIRRIKYGA